MRLVQLNNARAGRRIGLVREPMLVLLGGYNSVYDLAMAAIEKNMPLSEFADSNLSNEELDYDPVYKGDSEWQLGRRQQLESCQRA